MVESWWTEERKILARKLYIEEGYSAAEVARAIGGASRNAVIGMAHRSGWSRDPLLAAINNANRGRPVGEVAKRAPNLPRRKFQATVPGWRGDGPVAPTRPSRHGAPVESLNARPWTERAKGQCAFPVGDETGADQLSCCNPTTAVYCPGHEAVMFNGSPKVNASHRDDKPQRGLSRSERFFRGLAA